MELETSDTKSLALWILSMVMAIGAWFINRGLKRQDEHEDRIRALENTLITKEDLAAVYARVNALSDQSHNQYADILKNLNGRRRHDDLG